LHFVLGNEAADLDSIASSTACAHYFQNGRTGNNPKEHFCPLINIPKVDFPLRTDATWLFKDCKYDADQLLFYDEVRNVLDDTLKDHPNSVKFTLVDHNRLAQHQEHFGSHVDEIIDHHKDEQIYIDALKQEKRTIEIVGSATTLVAEKILNGNTAFIEADKSLMKLLLSGILLDTVNLDPQYKKVTKKDEEIAKLLSSKLGFSAIQEKALFDRLQEERFNVSSLGTIDLLRSDYKEWKMGKVEVGISSAKLSLKEWLAKESHLIEKCTEYSASRKLDILFVMTAYLIEDNKFKRELVIFTHNISLYQPVVDYLSKSELQLKPMEENVAKSLCSPKHVVGFFAQENVGASRKQLQPLLDLFYAK